MIGSTFIAEPDRSKLNAIESAEDLDAFAHVGLDRMTTIDVAEVLTANGMKWAEGKPVRRSEQDGFALFNVSEAGLVYALAHIADFPADCKADLTKLAAFLKQNGTTHIYELATF